MIKQIFVNLPVKDLEKTKEFWIKLGFTFNAQFTDENAASLELGENIYAMLITETYFKTFMKKKIADSTKVTEVINAVSVDSKEKVDQLVEKAYEVGATKYKQSLPSSDGKEADDYGWMYSRSFQDLDGHLWEVVYINESQIPADPSASEKS